MTNSQGKAPTDKAPGQSKSAERLERLSEATQALAAILTIAGEPEIAAGLSVTSLLLKEAARRKS